MGILPSSMQHTEGKSAVSYKLGSDPGLAYGINMTFNRGKIRYLRVYIEPF